MTDHTDAEIQALDAFTTEMTNKFVQDVLDLQLCGPCISMQVMTSLISTMVVNGFMSPDMVMNVSAHAINLALSPDDDVGHLERGVIYASKVH